MAHPDRSCSLAAMGMVNALGRSPEEIWPHLLAGDQSHFRVREDLVPDRSLVVGEVTGPATRKDYVGKGVTAAFPGYAFQFVCLLTDLSREPPPPPP